MFPHPVLLPPSWGYSAACGSAAKPNTTCEATLAVVTPSPAHAVGSSTVNRNSPAPAFRLTVSALVDCHCPSPLFVNVTSPFTLQVPACTEDACPAPGMKASAPTMAAATTDLFIGSPSLAWALSLG